MWFFKEPSVSKGRTLPGRAWILEFGSGMEYSGAVGVGQRSWKLIVTNKVGFDIEIE